MNAESADTQRHADVAGQAEAAETAVQAPPSRGEWLWSRVAGQPEALRKQVLANAVLLCPMFCPTAQPSQS